MSHMSIFQVMRLHPKLAPFQVALTVLGGHDSEFQIWEVLDVVAEDLRKEGIMLVDVKPDQMSHKQQFAK